MNRKGEETFLYDGKESRFEFVGRIKDSVKTMIPCTMPQPSFGMFLIS